MYNMMYGNGYGGYYDGGYGMVGGWGWGGGLVHLITLILVWALLVTAIMALWAWYKKNR